MLSENIQRAQKARGLSQEELAVKRNVVRQTVSKWENGLSVPDPDLLIALCAGTVLLYAAFAVMQGAYLGWDYGNPELAAAGTLLHGFEFVLVRAAPVVLSASVVGMVLTGRHRV